MAGVSSSLTQSSPALFLWTTCMIQGCHGRELWKGAVWDHPANFSCRTEGKGSKGDQQQWPCLCPHFMGTPVWEQPRNRVRRDTRKACAGNCFSAFCPCRWFACGYVTISSSSWFEDGSIDKGEKKQCSLFQILFLFFHDDSLKHTVQWALLSRYFKLQ